MANRLGARFAKVVAVAYPNTAKQLKSAKVVGNPLRESIVSAALSAEIDWLRARQSAKDRLQVSGPLALVIGGSSGSKAINYVISDSNFENCTVIHAVGKDNELPKGNDKYRPVAYIEDMATALLAADLVISRSGAIACSEFAALGKYALFIPLPIGNGEQELNAATLVAQERVILGDDMGLGKTRQAIIALKESAPLGVFLIICPASLKLNWAREIMLVDPNARIEVLGVSGYEHSQPQWVIVNYDLLARNADRLRKVA